MLIFHGSFAQCGTEGWYGMGVARVSLTRTKTGLWKGRKEIPQAIRSAYGKREEKTTWPAHFTDGQALAAYAAWRAPIEASIDVLKQKLSGAGLVRLTRQQAKALAGDWYRASVSGEDTTRLSIPGWELDWEATRANLFEESYDDETGDMRFVPAPALIDERDELLDERGLRVTDESGALVLEELSQLYLAYIDRLKRREAGDHGIDTVLATLPAHDTAMPSAPPPAPKATPKAVVSIIDLFERYADSGAANERTSSKWRPHVRHFVEHLGHNDATRVTRSDLNRWIEALVAKPLARKTITDSYIPAVRVALGIAFEDELIPANPARALKVRAPKAIETRERDLTDEEAETILRASLAPQSDKLPARHALARRWVPWLCAYTGARVGEMTQLRAGDIRKEKGIWVVHITPEAGSVKTGKARSVPIHSHLIEQGILALAQEGDMTPLFYDPAPGGGSKKNPPYKQRATKLAEWVRTLGVTAPAPNHGWRHRFKSVAYSMRLDPEAVDRAQGHSPRTEAGGYGKRALEIIRDEIEKLPRYDVFTADTGADVLDT